MVRSVVAGIALCAIAGGSAFAQQLPKGVVIVTPDKANWGNSSTPGAKAGVTQQSLLLGDPSKPGAYVYQNKFSPNNKVQPHSHPDSRTYTVLSGTWYVGFGDKFDESKLIALPAGTFYSEPAGVPHFVATKEDGARVQTSGTGPTRLIYVNPAPTKK
jgi:quercetin dioxygenase-like cupin family protein